ncbi:metallophosphoesterase family protein [Desulfurobacterium atlanticum]|uniref:Phosphoesterase, MJ0936 family n=1 Tax=Desulfurobacterium atlanticum TaxID=240169 RepID=A0A238ZA80_9BACT|nr:metallophosphoesterase [Desulfurobacterium atlanticum]SNR79703.1 phosphoesterase, MJ0936 family [Desulfurobacterium atlanticum]
MVKVAHISDTHITYGNAFNRTAFDIAIEKINKSDVDLVIHTGDVTDQGLRDEYEYAAFLFNKIEKPLIVVPGNHDVRNVGYELFDRFFGQFFKKVEVGGISFIPIDTTVPDVGDGELDFYEMERLKEKLFEEKETIKVVIGHHHLFPLPFTGRERNVISNSGDLIELFNSSGVAAYLSGHKHVFNVYKLSDTVVINAGAVSCRKTRKGDVNSFNFINFDNFTNGVDVTVIAEYIDGSRERKIFSIPEKSKAISDKGAKLLTIVQISNTCVSDRFYFRQDVMEKGIETINKINPDFVIHCGNIVDAGVERYFERAVALLSNLKSSLMVVPGRNDFSFNGDIFFFRYFSLKPFETEKIKFVPVVTVNKDAKTGRLGRSGLKFLKKELETEKEKIVYLHHNLLPVPHNRETGILEDAGDIIKLLIDKGVKLVLTGYGDNSFFTKLENVSFVNSGSFSWELHNNPAGFSFNLIEIYENDVCVKEIYF